MSKKKASKTKEEKPKMEVRDLKPVKNPKGGGKPLNHIGWLYP